MSKEQFHQDYMIRKQLRIQLQKRRCDDKDHSVERYMKDAEWLNKTLEIMGITTQRKAAW